MRWSEIPRRPPHSTLRWFSAIALMGPAAMALWNWANGNGAAAIALAVAAIAIGPLGLIRPAAVRPIFVGSLMLTFPIGWAVSHLVLGAVFYFVFTPLAVYFRLIGRDALGLRLRRDAETYWSPKPLPVDLRSYFYLS